MSITHMNPFKLIHLQPHGSKIGGNSTYALFTTEMMEPIRLILLAGKYIGERKALELAIDFVCRV